MSSETTAPLHHNNPPVTAPSEEDVLDDLESRYPTVGTALAQYEKTAKAVPQDIRDDATAVKVQDLLRKMRDQKAQWEKDRGTEKRPWDNVARTVMNFFKTPQDKLDALIKDILPRHTAYLERKAEAARIAKEIAAKAEREKAEKAQREAAAAEQRRLDAERAEREAREREEAAERRRAEAEQRRKDEEARAEAARVAAAEAEAKRREEARLAEIARREREAAAAKEQRERAEREKREAEARAKAAEEDRKRMDAEAERRRLAEAEVAKVTAERERLREADAQRRILAAQAEADKARAEAAASEARAKAAKAEEKAARSEIREAASEQREAIADQKSAKRDERVNLSAGVQHETRADRMDRKLLDTNDADLARMRGDHTLGSLAGRWAYDVVDFAELPADRLWQYVSQDAKSAAVYRYMMDNARDGNAPPDLPGAFFEKVKTSQIR